VARRAHVFWGISSRGAATVSALGWVAVDADSVNGSISRCGRLWRAIQAAIKEKHPDLDS
jgi:hypothetical protein